MRYEFGWVFLERHNYTLPEKLPAESWNNGQFASPYQNWRERYEQGQTEPAEALLEQYQYTVWIPERSGRRLTAKRTRQAALIFGAATILRHSVTAATDPADQPEYYRLIARIRARLSKDTYNAECAEGRAMPPDHLIEYLALPSPPLTDA